MTSHPNTAGALEEANSQVASSLSTGPRLVASLTEMCPACRGTVGETKKSRRRFKVMAARLADGRPLLRGNAPECCCH
jgi:hypothetical protein